MHETYICTKEVQTVDEIRKRSHSAHKKATSYETQLICTTMGVVKRAIIQMLTRAIIQMLTRVNWWWMKSIWRNAYQDCNWSSQCNILERSSTECIIDWQIIRNATFYQLTEKRCRIELHLQRTMKWTHVVRQKLWRMGSSWSWWRRNQWR